MSIVLVGQETKDNIKELADCDTVRTMYSDLVSYGISPSSEKQIQPFFFMQMVNVRFEKTKKKNDPAPKTIGAIAEALLTIEKENRG